MRGVFFFLLYGCVADCIIPTGNQFAPLPPTPTKKKKIPRQKFYSSITEANWFAASFRLWGCKIASKMEGAGSPHNRTSLSSRGSCVTGGGVHEQLCNSDFCP